MAKLTGPLLSFGARGAVGKTLVAAQWRGVKYMRQYVIPSNPRTTEQTVTRDTFAMLSKLWLSSPAEFQAPWTANSVGRRYTNRNKLVAENMPALRGQTTMANFIASPGALGGLPLNSINAVAGAGSGEIDVTLVPPTAPDGWTLVRVSIVTFPDQDPALGFNGPMIDNEDNAAPWTITVTDMGSAVDCIVSGWPTWTRPDGRTAYGASLTTTATSAV